MLKELNDTRAKLQVAEEEIKRLERCLKDKEKEL